MFPKSLVLPGLALLFSACVHYEARPIQPATTAVQFDNRSLDDAGLKIFFAANHTTIPTDRWDLAALTLAAFYFNPGLDVARAHWATIDAGRTTANERPNPTLGFSPAYNSSNSTPSPWIFGLNLDLPIKTAGKRGLRLAQSNQLATAARFALATAAWQVRADVRRVLTELASAQEEAKLRQTQATAQSRNVTLLEARFRAGESSAAEVSRERIALTATELAATAAQQRAATSRTSLAAAIGVPATALDPITLSFTGLDVFTTATDPAALRLQATTNRADVLGALADYAAAEAALQLAVAQQYPDIHLGPGYEYDQGDHKWSLGLSLELPLLNRQRGPIAEAVAQRAEAAATFNAVQARALGEVEQALAAYQAAQQAVTATTSLTTATNQQEQRLQATLATGEISAQEVAAAQVELAATRLARLDAITQARLALGTLEAAVQTPLPLAPSVWENSPHASADQR